MKTKLIKIIAIFIMLIIFILPTYANADNGFTCHPEHSGTIRGIWNALYHNPKGWLKSDIPSDYYSHLWYRGDTNCAQAGHGGDIWANAHNLANGAACWGHSEVGHTETPQYTIMVFDIDKDGVTVYGKDGPYKETDQNKIKHCYQLAYLAAQAYRTSQEQEQTNMWDCCMKAWWIDHAMEFGLDYQQDTGGKGMCAAFEFGCVKPTGDEYRNGTWDLRNLKVIHNPDTGHGYSFDKFEALLGEDTTWGKGIYSKGDNLTNTRCQQISSEYANNLLNNGSNGVFEYHNEMNKSKPSVYEVQKDGIVYSYIGPYNGVFIQNKATSIRINDSENNVVGYAKEKGGTIYNKNDVNVGGEENFYIVYKGTIDKVDSIKITPQVQSYAYIRARVVACTGGLDQQRAIYYGEVDNAEVKPISLPGIKKGSLTLIKVDEENPKKTLSGVQFVIKDYQDKCVMKNRYNLWLVYSKNR